MFKQCPEVEQMILLIRQQKFAGGWVRGGSIRTNPEYLEHHSPDCFIVQNV